MTQISTADIAAMIDHTILKVDATQDDIKKACEEALVWHFASVCVRSEHVAYAAKILKGSDVKVVAVVDFPNGEAEPPVKANEAEMALALGAQEIDMVLDVEALRAGDYARVFEGISHVVETCALIPVKVILETGALSDEHKIIACALSKAAGAAFVKTSTGFGQGGATVQDVALMRRVVGAHMGVKASGGIRTRQDAEAMIDAGATRIGASASVAIMTGSASNSTY